MELILSLDGGQTFPLRVTADVSKAAGRFSWRVPALFTERARLALRAGLDEQAGSEAILLLGSEFAIVPAPRSSLEELFRVKGEWRTREALESPAESPLEASLGEKSSEQMHATPEGAQVAEPPGSLALAVSEPATGHPSSNAGAQESSPLIRTTRPLSIPLRQ